METSYEFFYDNKKKIANCNAQVLPFTFLKLSLKNYSKHQAKKVCVFLTHPKLHTTHDYTFYCSLIYLYWQSAVICCVCDVVIHSCDLHRFAPSRQTSCRLLTKRLYICIFVVLSFRYSFFINIFYLLFYKNVNKKISHCFSLKHFFITYFFDINFFKTQLDKLKDSIF